MNPNTKLTTKPAPKPYHAHFEYDFACLGELFLYTPHKIHPARGTKNDRMFNPTFGSSAVAG